MGKVAPSPSGLLKAHALDFLRPGLADHSASSPAVPFQEGKGSVGSRPLSAPDPKLRRPASHFLLNPPGGCRGWFCLSGVWCFLGKTCRSPLFLLCAMICQHHRGSL